MESSGATGQPKGDVQIFMKFDQTFYAKNHFQSWRPPQRIGVIGIHAIKCRKTIKQNPRDKIFWWKIFAKVRWLSGFFGSGSCLGEDMCVLPSEYAKMEFVSDFIKNLPPKNFVARILFYRPLGPSLTLKTILRM